MVMKPWLINCPSKSARNCANASDTCPGQCDGISMFKQNDKAHIYTFLPNGYYPHGHPQRMTWSDEHGGYVFEWEVTK